MEEENERAGRKRNIRRQSTLKEETHLPVPCADGDRPIRECLLSERLEIGREEDGDGFDSKSDREVDLQAKERQDPSGCEQTRQFAALRCESRSNGIRR